jgi:membrane protease YdiL (CAAX protease family)
MLLELAASPAGAWILASLTTLLAVLESSAVPWAPFLIGYALILPVPGLVLGTARFGGLGAGFGGHPGAAAGLACGILAWEIGVMGFLYESIAPRLFRGPSERISPAAAMDALLEATSRRHRLRPKTVQIWAAAYFLLWAPLAEELFFWGYLYPVWRSAYGAALGAFLVAAFFAVRHGAHFLFLKGRYPRPAAIAFMASAGGAALANAWLLEICGSLWPLIAVHFASNLLSSAIAPRPAKRNS